MSSSSSSSSSYITITTANGVDYGGGGGGAAAAINNNNYIEHQVSKMDTLAGVAIKYGVEVADIKRMNGLATDLQMYALKSLHIPLLRRHPPASHTLSNGLTASRESSSDTPVRLGNSFESFQSRRIKSPQQKVSPAMSTLQNYYGLIPPSPKDSAEGMEMAVYSAGKLDHFDNGLRHKVSPTSENRLHKSSLLGNGSLLENGLIVKDRLIIEGKDGESGERSNENSVRRRQRAEVDSPGSGTPETLLKEENGGSSFSAVTGKGLALRPKSASKPSLVADTELGLGDPLLTGVGVHRSLSTPSLQDQESNNFSSVWLSSKTKWSLKQDLQSLSTASIARPIFDGLPTGRRNKAALD